MLPAACRPRLKEDRAVCPAWIWSQSKASSGAIRNSRRARRQNCRAWEQKAEEAETGLERSVYLALVKAATAVSKKHGLLIGDASLLSKLAVPIACNAYSSEAIGRHIEPYFLHAVSEEGYKLLPSQTHPVIMNVKGASASGKSTLRPLQKELAVKLGIPWDDVALISPDIWRKYLLDYDSLGPARKYAGALTGQELAIVDKKLDRHLMNKGENGQLPHLVIDRFRFDSFATDKGNTGPFIERFGHSRLCVFHDHAPGGHGRARLGTGRAVRTL